MPVGTNNSNNNTGTLQSSSGSSSWYSTIGGLTPSTYQQRHYADNCHTYVNLPGRRVNNATTTTATPAQVYSPEVKEYVEEVKDGECFEDDSQESEDRNGGCGGNTEEEGIMRTGDTILHRLPSEEDEREWYGVMLYYSLSFGNTNCVRKNKLDNTVYENLIMFLSILYSICTVCILLPKSIG